MYWVYIGVILYRDYIGIIGHMLGLCRDNIGIMRHTLALYWGYIGIIGHMLALYRDEKRKWKPLPS